MTVQIFIKKLAFIPIFLGFFGLVSAQVDTVRGSFGVFGGVQYALHSADFSKLPGIPSCCPTYSGGSGIGYAFGLLYEQPLGKSGFYPNFFLNVRTGISSYGGLLTSDETTYVDLGNGTGANGTFRHSLKSVLRAYSIEPTIAYRASYPFSVSGGIRIGVVSEKSFEQKEEIIEPSDRGVFPDSRTRTRNVYTGELPDGNALNLALLLGASYELPMNREKTLFLEPFLQASYSLTSVVSDVKWKVHPLRLGLALKFSPQSSPKVPPAPPPPVEIPKNVIVESPKPPISADIFAFSVDKDGTEREKFTIRVEEFLTTELRPLLNYVFFEENSAVIPERYSQKTAEERRNFSIDKLYNFKTIPMYYEVLNIVGVRMNQYPDAMITLVGCNSDEGMEKGNKSLSADRAESIRQYLESVWGISRTRIKTEVWNLPEKPSNRNEKDGIEENRRVEILSTRWEVLAPVFTTDTVRTVSPPLVRFRPKYFAPAGLKQWTMGLHRNGKPFYYTVGEENFEYSDVNFEKYPSLIPRLQMPIEYFLNIQDSIGQNASSVIKEIPVELTTIQQKRGKRIADKETDTYSLILFDFDKSGLNDANQRIVEYILGNLPEGAKVTISGYTDRMGDADYNRRLSTTRAQSAAKALGFGAESANGVGEAVLLYDNYFPEGRFYCRTVNVIVEKDVKK